MIFAKDKPGLARSVQEMRGGNVRSTPPRPDPYLSSDEDFENW
jgi:hypothetical protein